jgi:hypothetical protein
MVAMSGLKVVLSSLLLTFCLASLGQAQRSQYLGEANVDGGMDHDRIQVSNRTPYRAIQIQVDRAAVTFERVIVHFGNGQSTPIQIANTIRAGGKTRVIDLPGERRFIDNVEFFYRRGNWNNANKPKVRLFGIR